MGSELTFVGASPSALLWDGGEPTAFVSVWQADWSTEGAGGAIFLLRPGEFRILCDPPLLGRWLYDTFVIHYGELASFPDRPARPAVERTPVKMDVDLTSGLHATAGDINVRITGILDRRRTLENGLRMGNVPWSLSRVYMPCRSARIEAGGSVVPGLPKLKESGSAPASSAYLSVAETWARL